jgi:hypothetical protein
MAKPSKPAKGKTAPKKKPAPKPAPKAAPKPARAKAEAKAEKPKPAAKAASKPAPKPVPAPAKATGKPAKAAASAPAAKAAPEKPAKVVAPPPKPVPGLTLPPGAPPQSGPPPKKAKKRADLAQRRGPDGQLLQPGDIVIPGGPTNSEEIFYLLRGCVAAEHAAGELGVAEVLARRGLAEPAWSKERDELARLLAVLIERFERGIDPMLPPRPASAPRRTFASVVERARNRRREVGAFLRGLDLGGTETSHMDPHGEASLSSLMEWAARLERLTEADEPQKADFQQFHRVLDQLELNTEALMVDVEQTLRRLRDRLRAR